jgi:hypothetical protein
MPEIEQRIIDAIKMEIKFTKIELELVTTAETSSASVVVLESILRRVNNMFRILDN